MLSRSPRPRRFTARILVALAAAGLFTAACDVHSTTGPGTLVSMTVTPNVTLAINGTQQFTAAGVDGNGDVVVLTPVWTVEAGGGTINATTGFFTAGTVPGVFNATVKATQGTISGTANVTVTVGPLATITVTPTPVSLGAGTTQLFTAVGRDAANNVVVITPVWSVVALGGTINAASGLFTAGGVLGTFTNTVRATSGAIFGSATVTVVPGALATITVTPNPDTLNVLTTGQFTAVGRDALNNIVVITPVWSVTNGGGSISLGGLFTAGNTTGSFTNTVRATSGVIFGSATVVVDLPPVFQPLGAATSAGILAATAVTCISTGFINADIIVSPGNTITGFPPCTFSGVLDLATAVGTQAQIDLTTAYNNLAGLPCPPANAIVADLGGTTKAAGVYCTASGIGVTGDLTLDGGGDPNAVFVFQAGSTLITAGNVILINGATARNVYWQIGTSATLGTASQWQGNILSNVSITLVDGATLLGRALARTGAVTLGTTNTITLP